MQQNIKCKWLHRSFVFLLSILVATSFMVPGSLGAFGAQEARAAEPNPTLMDEKWVNYDDNGDGSCTIVDFNYQPGGVSPTEIKIPAAINGLRVSAIADNAFSGSGLTYVEFEEGSTITSIGESAFAGNDIKKIEANGPDVSGDPQKEYTLNSLPLSVATLGASCFDGNKNLASINLSKLADLEQIPYKAFLSCSLTGGVKLPPALTTIANQAFSNTSCTRFEIPATVTSIGADAFYGGAKARRVIDLSDHEPDQIKDAPWRAGYADVVWKNTNGEDDDYETPFLFDREQKMIYGLKSDLKTKDYNGWTKPVTDNNGVTTGGVLTIPATINGVQVEKMACATFAGYTTRGAIREINFANGSSIKAIPTAAFEHTPIKTVGNVPAGITTVGGYAFNNSTIENINLPGVTEIGVAAFYFCNSLTELTVGGNVTAIGGDAFRAAPKLRNVYMRNTTKIPSGWSWGADRARFYWANGQETAPKYDLVEDVTGDWLVDTDKKLIMGYLGSDASITIPASVEVQKDGVTKEYPITTIGDTVTHLLDDNENIKRLDHITIADGITVIKAHALEELGLSSIDLGTTVKSIELCALNKNKLTKIKIPDSVTSLGKSALANNKISGVVTIPGNVTSIQSDSFTGNPITEFRVKMYLNTPSDKDENGKEVYNDTFGWYKKAPAGVKNRAPWGVPAASSRIYYEDQPKAVVRHETKVDKDNNKVTIEYKANTNNNFFIIKSMTAASKMPALNNVNLPTTQGLRNAATADMEIDSKATSAVQGGNGTYRINLTFGSQIEGSEIEDKGSTYDVEIDAFHSLTYDANGGGKPVSGTAPTAGDVYVEGHTPALKDKGNLAINGYSFGGWNTKADGSGETHAANAKTFSMPNANATLYAVWNANDNDVVFNGNGGKFGSAATKTLKGKTDQALSAIAGYDMPVREGYEFQGWATSSGATAENITTVPAGGTTVYAVWKAGTGITLAANGNGGKFGNATSKNFTNGTVGNPITAMTGYEAPKREGYAFQGWATASNATAPNLTNVPTKSQTIYAVWKANNYKVTFNANGGKIGNATTKEISGAYNTALTSMTGYAAPTRDGYDFKGWATSNNATAANITNVPAKDQTVYAVWTKKTIEVTFNANGGAFASGTTKKVSGLYETRLTDLFYYEIPDKQDYDLVGWATSSNATAVNIYTVPATNQTVYAVWKASTADSATKNAATSTINAAKADMDAAIVSTNGTDVWTTDKWVNQAHKDAMAAAIQKAEGVVKKDGVTTVEIKAAMAELESAKETFERDKRDGIKSQPNAEEQAIIDGARKALNETKQSNDGTDVEPSEMWVSPAVYEDLKSAVEAAEAAITDDSKNGAAKSEAIQAVAQSKEAFDAAKKPGDQAAADARALAKAKNDAKAELDKVDVSIYEEPEKSAVTKAVEDGKKEIDAATTIPQVDAAKKKALDTIAAQKTAAQKQAERDAEKKETEDPKNIPTEVTDKTPANLVAVTTAITTAKNDGDLKGSTYAPLKFMSKKQTKKSIKLQWSKVKGAKQYTVYANQCGVKNKYKKLATVKGKTLNVKKVAGKKLKKGTNYKFLIIAENGDNVSAISKTLHIRTAGHKKYTNYKSVSVKKTVIKKAKKLKKGKTLKLNAKGVVPKGKKVSVHVKTRYESSNKKVATVTKAGKVKGIKKGKAKIYCYVQNGLAKVVTVTVK